VSGHIVLDLCCWCRH